MGFNLGIGLGAGVQSALQMYGALQAGQRNQLEIDKLTKEAEQEKALDAAYAQSQGRVGQADDYAQAIQTQGGAGSQQAKMLSDQGALAGNTPDDIAFEKASAQAATGAMRENAGQAEAPASAISPQAYTQNQANKDYVQAASKISRKGAMEALQMKSVTRASDIEDRFDTAQTQFQDHLTKIHSAGETGGMKGLSDAANKEGLNTRFKEGKNGLGIIEVLGPKGDVLKTYNDTKAATDALVGTASKHFQDSLVTMFGSADKAAAFYETRRGNDIKEKEANDKGNYYNAVANAYNTGAKGGGGGANSAANQEKLVTSQAETIMKGQPGRFKDMDQAKAWIVNSKLKGYNADTEWGKAELELIKQGTSPSDIVKQKDSFFARQGFAPESIASVARTGRNPETDKPFTEQEKQAFYKRYPHSDIEFGSPEVNKQGAPAAALPTKGGYVPEAGSPAAKSVEKRQAAIDLAAKEATARKTKIEEAKAGAFNPASQFEKDKGTMSKAELQRKYMPLQRGLTAEQFDYLNQ